MWFSEMWWGNSMTCLKTMLLKPEDHYSQRNNPMVNSEFFTVYGHSACMPTTRVSFYKAAKIPYTNPSDLPDDAYFTELLISKEAVEFARIKYPWAFKDGKCIIPPNEIHGMYGSWLDKKVTGKRRTDFKTDLTWEDFVCQVAVLKNPVMTSGSFPRLPGHAFTFVGYDPKTEELRVSDPYGNPHLGYKGKEGVKGYDIRYNKEYFNEHVKKTGLKWGHVLL